MELTSNRRLARLTSRTISLGLGRLRSRGMKSRRLRACIAQVRCQCRTNRSWPVPAPEGPGVQSSARHSHETGRGRLSTWAVNAAVAVAEVPLGSRPNCFNSRPRDPSVLALVSLPPAARSCPNTSAHCVVVAQTTFLVLPTGLKASLAWPHSTFRSRNHPRPVSRPR